MQQHVALACAARRAAAAAGQQLLPGMFQAAARGWAAPLQHLQHHQHHHQHPHPWLHAAARWLTIGQPLRQQQQEQLQQGADEGQAPPEQDGLAVDEVFVDHRSTFSTGCRSDAAHTEQEPHHGGPPITAIFLHGLLGSSRNWRSFTRKLAQDAAARANRDVRVLLVDLRCHGASAARYGMHPPHDMAAAASDVAQVVQRHLGGAAPHLLVGLSLGGKVALQLVKQLVAAQEQQKHAQHLYDPAPPIAPPEDRPAGTAAARASAAAAASEPAPLRGLPQQVWVLDSQPGTVPIDVDAPTSVGTILQLIHEVPTPLDSRQALYRLLADRGVPQAVAHWLGTSLVPGGRLGAAAAGGGGGGGNGSGSSSDSGGGSDPPAKLDWAFDIQGCAAMYNAYRLSSYWDVLSRPPPGVVVHLVRGELSDRWTPHMLQQLEEAERSWREHSSEAPEAVGELQLHVLEKAGHWLQADNPAGLLAMMEPWVRDLRQNRLLF